MNPFITVIIPAYNEENTVREIVRKTKEYANEVIVIDDGSQDQTGLKAKEAGAKVIRFSRKKGVMTRLREIIPKIQRGIIIKIDADGEHNPEEIPKLINPILKEEADLVLGIRSSPVRLSKRIIDWIANLKVPLKGSTVGFFAGRKELLEKLNFNGKCYCGVLILEAFRQGARIKGVPVRLEKVEKKRKIAWHHFLQIFYVLWQIIKKK